jgi:hypothetical protein
MTRSKNNAMSRLHLPEKVTAAEPWLKDHYELVRTEVGPRWEHTRAVVAPTVNDAVTKLRTEVAPNAAQTVNRLTNEAVRRSGPMRAEAASRSAATLAAMRGQVSPDDIARLNGGSKRRKLWFLAVAGTGAVAATGVVLWQRMRAQAWVEDDAVLVVLDENEPNAEDLEYTDPAAAGPASPTSPADPEGGTSADQPEHVAAGDIGKKH